MGKREIKTLATLKITDSRLRKLWERYNSTFQIALFQLYDLGYLSTPSMLDEKEVREVLFKNFQDSAGYLVQKKDGIIDIKNVKLLWYSYYKSKDSIYKKYILMVIELMQARNKVVACSEFIKRAKKRRTKQGEYCYIYTLNVARWGEKNRGRYEFLRELDFMRDMLSEGYLLYEIDIRKIVYSFLEKELGVKPSKKSIFVEGLSREQEIDLIQEIIQGNIEVETKQGRLLKDKIKEFQDKKRQRGVSKSYYNYLITQNLWGFYKYMTSNQKKDYENCYTGESVIMQRKREEKENESFSWLNHERGEVPLGSFVYDRFVGKEMPLINRLKGYSGEFIKRENLEEKGYKVRGLPIRLIEYINPDTLEERVGEYYPLYCVCYNDVGNWEDCIPYEIGVKKQVVPKTLQQQLGVTMQGGMDEMQKALVRLQKKVNRKLPKGISSKERNVIYTLLIELLLSESGGKSFHSDMDITKEEYIKGYIFVEQLYTELVKKKGKMSNEKTRSNKNNKKNNNERVCFSN